MLPTYHSSTRTLLYVEDDPDARRLFELAAHVAKAQFHLHAVGCSEEATDYLTGRAGYDDRSRFPLPEGILLDFSLGRRTAVDLLSWMRDTIALQTEVAIFSASDDSDQIARSYVAGADYYVVKPARFERLVHIAGEISRGFHANSKPCLTRLVFVPEYRPSQVTAALTNELRTNSTCN